MLPIDILLKFNPKHILPIPVENILISCGINIIRKNNITGYYLSPPPFPYNGILCPNKNHNTYYDRYSILKVYVEEIIHGGLHCPSNIFISDFLVPPIYLKYFMNTLKKDKYYISKLSKIFGVPVDIIDKKIITLNNS